MLFSSIPFLYYFLPPVLALYFFSPKKWRNAVLLLASLIFYGWGEPRYVLLMLVSVFFGYLFGLLIERFRETPASKAACILSVAVSLSFLLYFKYTDFFLESFNAVTGQNIPLLKIALPIGISFYTFQVISYTIDVYRGVPAQKSFVRLAAYISMFPQLIAGPIVRYSDIAAQLEERTLSVSAAAAGIRRFILGLAKKILLANQLGEFCAVFRASDEKSVLFYWLYAAAFALQIYFDFSGYSDMAIGLGRILGFDFLENFNYPYISASITEFWRRWHISLGTWFREYVYIPMGGNRCGMERQMINILTVWCLTGFWHGASWNFVLWGLYFGVLLIAEKQFLLKLLKKAPAWLSHIYALVLVVVSWVLFAFEDVSKAGAYIRTMFGGGQAGVWNGNASYYLGANALLIAACALFSTNFAGRLGKRIRARAAFGEGVCAALGIVAFSALFLLSVCFLVGDSYNPFLYFRF